MIKLVSGFGQVFWRFSSGEKALKRILVGPVGKYNINRNVIELFLFKPRASDTLIITINRSMITLMKPAV